MWNAKYKQIDRGGLRQELQVVVLYYNDIDDTTYEKVYDVLPIELDSPSFQGLVQNQIDILNAKNDAKLDTTNLVDKTISEIKAID